MNQEGDLLIYDWKRVKDMNFNDDFLNKKAITTCINYLPDTNYWHYSLQLNLYKTILEHKYGKKVVELCLVCLHPENQTYIKHEVSLLDDEMNNLIEFRKEQLFLQKEMLKKRRDPFLEKKLTTKQNYIK